MEGIGLQKKAKLKEGTIEKYWFENESIGLKKTLFHRIEIPLEPFESGLKYEDQPIETEIVIEWIEIGNPNFEERIRLSSLDQEGMEASIYLGGAHNNCEIIILEIKSIGSKKHKINGEFIIHFVEQGIGKDEGFEFETIIKEKN